MPKKSQLNEYSDVSKTQKISNVNVYVDVVV